MSSIISDEPSGDEEVNTSIEQSNEGRETLPIPGDEISHINETEENNNLLETTLINAVQRLIQLGGSAFSIGAIRDLGDLKENSFDFKSDLFHIQS